MDQLELKIGEIDARGRKVLAVYSSSNNHIVYGTDSGVRHYSRGDSYRRIKENQFLFSTIFSLMTGSIINNESVNLETARAIELCMLGRIKEANLILSQLEKRLINIRTIKGRLSYLLACALSAVCFLILLIFDLWAGSIYPDGVFGSSETLFKIAACGALGGFLSVSLGIRNVEIDMDEDWSVSAISGATRILIAVIGSLFIYFAIDSGIVFAKLAELGATGIYAISILAGFSETLVPNILNRVAKEETPEPSSK